MKIRRGKPAEIEVSLERAKEPAARLLAEGTAAIAPGNGSGPDYGPLFVLLNSLAEKVGRVESIVSKLANRNEEPGGSKEFYTTTEFAEKVGRAEYTCRQWCLNERINAIKADSGRGRFGEWRIPHAELVRYLNHGLIPIERKRR